MPARILIEKSELASAIQSRDKTRLRETRTVAPPLPFKSLLLLWNAKAALITFAPKSSIVVLEEKGMTQIFHSLFETLWEGAEKNR